MEKRLSNLIQKVSFFIPPIQKLAEATQVELLAEPSFKQATADFAWEKGGPITREILSQFRQILTAEEYQNIHVDTKVQTIHKNEYSNTPGWHCDFFSTTDEQEDRLVRTNPGLETGTRVFLLISGQPATEFMRLRNLPIDIEVPTWSHISEYIDSFVKSEDLYRIPEATPVELTGDELHRVTLYEGEEPTVRYFMRVYLFPEDHSLSKLYKNELFDWETHSQNTLGDVSAFLDRAFAHLDTVGLDVSPYEMTHLCYRVSTPEELPAKKGGASKRGLPH